jgi:hypothetical protein
MFLSPGMSIARGGRRGNPSFPLPDPEDPTIPNRYIAEITFFGDQVITDAEVGDVVSQIKVEMSDGAAFSGTLTLTDDASGKFSLHANGTDYEIRVAASLAAAAGTQTVELTATSGELTPLVAELPIVVTEAEEPPVVALPLDDVDLTVLPLDERITFTSASKRWSYDASDNLDEFAVDTPRLKYRSGVPVGLYVEQARTNIVPNPQATGITNGVKTAGVLCTNWRLELGGTCVATVSNAGSVDTNGEPYFDIRFSGTSTGSNFAKLIPFGTATRNTAVNGNSRKINWPTKIAAGAFTIVGHRMNFEHRMYNAGGSFVNNIESSALTNSSTFLMQTSTATLNQATTATYEFGIFFRFQAAGSHDVTVRIYAPDGHDGTVHGGSRIIEGITRAAETITIDDTDGSATATQGSMFLDFEVEVLDNDADLTLARWGSATNNFEFVLDTSNVIRAKITAGGVLQMNAALKTITEIDTQYKIGLGWILNDCIAAANEEDAVFDTSVTMPTTPTGVVIGNFPGVVARFQFSEIRETDEIFIALVGANGNTGGGSTPSLDSVTDTVTFAANNEVIENKHIVISNKDGVVAQGKSGCVLRNCLIEHTGTGYAMRIQDSPGFTLDSCRVLKDDAPATGYLPSERNGVFINRSSDFTAYRVHVADFSACFYIVASPRFHGSYIQMENPRGPGPNRVGSANYQPGIPDGSRGQAIQFNNSPDYLLEDFSIFADPEVCWSEDLVSSYDSPRGILRRGRIHGGNSPTGWGIMIETSVTGVTGQNRNEDIDITGWCTGAAAAYDAATGVVFLRVRVRDSTLVCGSDRGNPTSGSLTFASGPGTSGTQIDDCNHFNLANPGNMYWQAANFALRDSTSSDFTARDYIALANMPGD